jgi:D-alanyl-D-alanine dipeptidase
LWGRKVSWVRPPERRWSTPNGSVDAFRLRLCSALVQGQALDRAISTDVEGDPCIDDFEEKFRLGNGLNCRAEGQTDFSRKPMTVKTTSVSIRSLWRFVQISFLLAIVLPQLRCSAIEQGGSNQVPVQFVDVADYFSDTIPTAVLDVRYFSEDNFIGTRIDGYRAAKIFMTRAAADALKSAQTELHDVGLGLKIFDAYRPQRAVDHFVRWGQELEDVKMQRRYYPNVEKKNLFNEGYISERSGHSRGSTVDLTLINLESGQELDMGTPWDYFDPLSWPSSENVSSEQRVNRYILRDVMLKYGFRPIAEEWWHFTLENEPFADTYFDFPIY